MIDGKKYELEGNSVNVAKKTPGLIVPGEYKARITTNKYKGTYAYARGYELLFPDGTTGGFWVNGESE